jgi:hypothetical protein
MTVITLGDIFLSDTSKYRDEDSHDRRLSVEELSLQSSMVIETKMCTRKKEINKHVF